MIEIDGGEGGGGVLRTALGLAIATATPVRIENVRGDRPEPGLKPQHVTAIEAARAVCDARVEGGRTGEGTVEFEPGSVRGTTVELDVGTAGSATLVCSTVLPAAFRADAPIRLHVTGGTDVAWSPPVDYWGGVTLSLLGEHGVPAAIDVTKRGFYPVGDGGVSLTLGPAEPTPILIDTAPDDPRLHVSAVASEDLADAEVADRMAREATRQLSDHGHSAVSRSTEYASVESTGAALLVRVEDAVGSGAVVPVAGFTGLGEPGTPSEEIATDVVESATAWFDTDAAVDRRLADQLVPYLALAGGTVSIPAVTDHVTSAIDVASAFGFDVSIEQRDDTGDTDERSGAGTDLDPVTLRAPSPDGPGYRN